MSKKTPKPQANAVDAAPFQKPFMVATLSRARPHGFDLRPDREEAIEIAGFLGISDVNELRFKGDLTAQGDEDWRIDGRLTASVTQECVVTLAPVGQKIDESVHRHYVPGDDQPEIMNIDLDLDSDDESDTYKDVIDPGQLALEALALALDPYPRAPDAELDQSRFAAPGVTPLTDNDLKPFAGLAALKDKMEKGDGNG